MTTDRWIRVSDQDRQCAVELLSEAYAAGRLSREDLDERVTAAYLARTSGELRDLTADLPCPVAPTGPLPEPVASRRAPQRASRLLVSVMVSMFFALVLVTGQTLGIGIRRTCSECEVTWMPGSCLLDRHGNGSR